jgi:hypothetical protein
MTSTTRLLPAAVAVLALTACSDLATEPDRHPAILRVSPDTVVVTEGETVAFQVEVLDQNGDAYDRIPSWAPPRFTSSDASLLRMEASGIGQTLGPGQSGTIVELAGLQTRATVRANPSELGLDVPVAYVTQSTQRHDMGVPLIAGREGLLRVFVTGSVANFFRPSVRAVFTLDGVETHSMVLGLERVGLPLALDEGDLRYSFDGVVPATILVPGVSMHVEVDPDGVIPSSEGSVLRVPASGGMALDVRPVRPFRLRIVPVHHTRDSEMDQALAQGVTRMAADVFPFGEFDLDVREPYVTEADLGTEQGWFDLIYEIALLREDDGSDRYYYGGFQRLLSSSIRGLGYIGYPVSIGTEEEPATIAHEIGHNLGLPHAPCGGPEGADSRYPYANGSIGQFGYDRSGGRVFDPAEYVDLMSYCDPVWISDYNYRRVIEYRDSSEYDAAFEEPGTGAVRSADGPVLLVGGGVRGGELVLQPALSAGPGAGEPAGGGRYTLEGLDGAGQRIFTLRVEPRPLDHGDNALFVVAVPVEVARPDRLVTLRLSGPEGTVERTRARGAGGPEVALERSAGQGGRGLARAELVWDSGAWPLAVARDRRTGRIVGMAREGRLPLRDADPATVDVILSDGVSSQAARVTVR